MEIKSLRNNVLVKILPIGARKYKNLIIIPDTARNRDLTYFGIVESVGDGVRSKKGVRRPIEVSKGDLVVFPRHNGTRVMIDNTEYRYLKFNDIIAILEEEE
jgi:chaperonin GroES